jgi:tyramine---L-glutamate ligase
MQILVYEHITALGIGGDPADPMHAMHCEGRAMRDAVAGDLARIAGVVVVFRGPCDAAVVIAPETGGALLELSRSFPNVIGPSVEAIALTSDKLALARHWRENGVPTPATSEGEPDECAAFPLVWKPRDGCGSTATYLLNDHFAVAAAKAAVAATEPGPMILQEFVPGRAASVAFLCGPAGNFPLVPCWQHLSADGSFHYLGGELPIPPELASRAVKIGTRAIGCVPGLKGYIGVDLVLGDAPDGSRDSAIEINPRLTTSYIGLRALAGFNVAEAMLRVAQAEAPPEMRWKKDRVQFTAESGAERFC